ncbi:MAG: 16S rRNA (guanine(527)-N(7))-methyltransferase RsmG [Gammaproteobacteria bacterium]
MTGSGLTARLSAALADCGITGPASLADRLAAYLELLDRWNRSHNLTSVRDPEEMVTRHLLDSLVVLPWLHGPRIADVGSGAGLPGLPLAMARPDFGFLLLDSAAKRVSFLRHVVARLGLENVRVIHARVEDYADEAGFDTVISRAFAALADFVNMAGHLCGPGGRLLAMKGRLDPSETEAVPEGWVIRDSRRLTVPGSAGERHLLEIVRRGAD